MFLDDKEFDEAVTRQGKAAECEVELRGNSCMWQMHLRAGEDQPELLATRGPLTCSRLLY